MSAGGVGGRAPCQGLLKAGGTGQFAPAAGHQKHSSHPAPAHLLLWKMFSSLEANKTSSLEG